MRISTFRAPAKSISFSLINAWSWRRNFLNFLCPPWLYFARSDCDTSTARSSCLGRATLVTSSAGAWAQISITLESFALKRIVARLENDCTRSLSVFHHHVSSIKLALLHMVTVIKVTRTYFHLSFYCPLHIAYNGLTCRDLLFRRR